MSSATDSAQDAARSAAAKHPKLAKLTVAGWIAKGVVYALMGFTTFSIATQSGGSGSGSGDDKASPQGSLAKIAEASFGQILLWVIAFGLILYVIWRIFSIVAEDSDLEGWLHRIGYGISAATYVGLAWTAGQAASRGGSVDQQSSIEKISKAMLENSIGRWVLGIGGVIAIGVAIYFAVYKGVMRKFVEDLDGISDTTIGGANEHNLIVLLGSIGWVGRGIVTGLVGFFITRSAIEFDKSDAKGLDQSLRSAAEGGLGTALVMVAGVALIAYGVFCALSSRHRSLDL